MLVQVPAVLEQRDSSESLELDILRLSQRWEAQRTIRSGDTPGDALRKGDSPRLRRMPMACPGLLTLAQRTVIVAHVLPPGKAGRV